MTQTASTSASVSAREVDTATGPVLVHELGDPAATPVILLHDEVVSVPGAFAGLLAADHRVIAPVLPGFGASQRPDWVETVPLMVEHLMAFIDTLDVTHPDGQDVRIVGASLGGWVAAEIALRLAHRSPRLALLGPAGLHVPGHPTADHWFVDPEDRRDILWHDASAAPEVDIDEYLANEESAARYAWNPRFVDDTLGPRLARLRGSTLVVFGAQDRFLSAQHPAAWQQAVPTARCEVLADTGHFVAHERPDHVAGLVTAFLAGDGPSGALSGAPSSTD